MKATHGFWTKRIPVIITSLCIALLAASVAIFFTLLDAPTRNASLEYFTVPLDADNAALVRQLKEQGFIRSDFGFQFIHFLSGNNAIESGVYEISKSMNVWKLNAALQRGPHLVWVVIPEGIRKEQIADILGEKLNWSTEEKRKWVTTYSAMKFDYVEGVDFPDSYLIPTNEAPLEAAERLQGNFEEKISSFSQELQKQNIQWTTLLKLASIVQREAAGKEDMPLIAGILWNRLLQGMNLEVDATIQYARDTKLNYPNDPCEDSTSDAVKKGLCNGDSLIRAKASYIGGQGWWSPIKPADKNIVSEYNTYLNKGLPPHPISNPGIDALNAVLYPVDSDCLYYLHDDSRAIHCTKTFVEHQANIEKYLR